ncbi:MAG: hypothetical protein MHM6MM_006788 [Cercozoa sp. M6MM]
MPNIKWLPSSNLQFWRSIEAVLNDVRVNGVASALKNFMMFDQVMIGKYFGELKGVDEHGNKYYEGKFAQNGRHRWVEYADAPFGKRPDKVSPEWFMWLHHTSDMHPGHPLFTKPKFFELQHSGNPTDTKTPYVPSNYKHGRYQAEDYTSWDPSQGGVRPQ